MKEIILKYALQNAIKYEGEANAGALVGRIVQEKPEYKNRIKELSKEISVIVSEVNKMSLDEQLIKLQEIAPELLEEKPKEEKHELKPLPNAINGKVVLRLAPFPSGALHIGNTKTYLLNALYAERYNGKTFLVIDDTVGSQEKQIMKEAYDLIPEAFKWLKVNFEEPIVYKSDRLEIYYQYAEELIKKGMAYVCTCNTEILRANRANGVECTHRNQEIFKVLEDWQKMFTMKEGDAVLRLKTDMKYKDPAFRDRVLFRISNREHPRVGTKYTIWPMLEFSWAIDDHLLGITHVIRGKDLMIESEMEKFIWKIFNWKAPELLHAGLIRIKGVEGVKLSKSKAQAEVKSGEFIGWDDPRTWSVQSLRRRGFSPESIREFILSIGLNQNDIEVPIDVLYAINKKMLDPIVNRYFLIEKPVQVDILNAPEIDVELNLHPDYPDRGKRFFSTSGNFYIAKSDIERLEEGKMYRLMDCLNFVVKNNKFVFDSAEHEKYKTAANKGGIMHYLPVADLPKFEMMMPDGSTIKGFCEFGVEKLEKDDIIQAERLGFVKLDSIDVSERVYKFWYAHK